MVKIKTMDYLRSGTEAPQIIVKNSDVVNFDQSSRQRLRSLAMELEGVSVILDVTDVISMPLPVAVALIQMSLDIGVSGGSVTLRATESVAGPMQILGASRCFKAIEIGESTSG